MDANVQLAGVRQQAVNSTKIAELPNTYNGNYETLRLENQVQKQESR